MRISGNVPSSPLFSTNMNNLSNSSNGGPVQQSNWLMNEWTEIEIMNLRFWLMIPTILEARKGFLLSLESTLPMISQEVDKETQINWHFHLLINKPRLRGSSRTSSNYSDKTETPLHWLIEQFQSPLRTLPECICQCNSRKRPSSPHYQRQIRNLPFVRSTPLLNLSSVAKDLKRFVPPPPWSHIARLPRCISWPIQHSSEPGRMHLYSRPATERSDRV